MTSVKTDHRKSSSKLSYGGEDKVSQELLDNSEDRQEQSDRKIKNEMKEEEEEDSTVKSTKSPRGRKPKVDSGHDDKTDISESVTEEARKDLADDEKYCQPHHMPHLCKEEVSDKDYLTKLQAIASAISSPHTQEEVLNSIVDVILDTGNFVTTSNSFDFDLCNLDKQSVNRISDFLKLGTEPV